MPARRFPIIVVWLFVACTVRFFRFRVVQLASSVASFAVQSSNCATWQRLLRVKLVDGSAWYGSGSGSFRLNWDLTCGVYNLLPVDFPPKQVFVTWRWARQKLLPFHQSVVNFFKFCLRLTFSPVPGKQNKKFRQRQGTQGIQWVSSACRAVKI